jgi:hypothetical protein
MKKDQEITIIVPEDYNWGKFCGKEVKGNADMHPCGEYTQEYNDFYYHYTCKCVNGAEFIDEAKTECKCKEGYLEENNECKEIINCGGKKDEIQTYCNISNCSHIANSCHFNSSKKHYI